MRVFVKIENGSEFVGIELDAIELLELKFECEFTCEPRLKSSNGEMYAIGLIRVLCLDGMRIARRKLSMQGGLRIDISGIAGVLEKSNEVGVCHVTGLAIAKALGKNELSLVAAIPDWAVAKT
ncbi:hypothetical protein [Schlesneria paludicola]|uniref:hypothetical protein n=1 Tax=Schlesneria paludicola TaxID=360056 RepID=UPI00029AF1D2|nr:hypothetical protein [Schlesneria paludicola]